ncbi:MAG: BON domain-containing protein [Gammaproteobacteria bacterium]|nr:BON domain-containing protein [Gammaproteobacteria bacterium]
MARWQELSDLLSAAALGVVALVAGPVALPQTHATTPATVSAPATVRAEARPEVLITAARESDAVLAARVEVALQSDPYLFVSHVSVSAENGVVRLEGVVEDPFDMLQLVRLARRIAGKRRVINEIEVVSGGVDHD